MAGFGWVYYYFNGLDVKIEDVMYGILEIDVLKLKKNKFWYVQMAFGIGQLMLLRAPALGVLNAKFLAFSTPNTKKYAV